MKRQFKKQNRYGWTLDATDFLRVIRDGVEIYGYPKCCARAFARDVASGRSPGERRGLINGERQRGPLLASGDRWTEWVPCRKCRRNFYAERKEQV